MARRVGKARLFSCSFIFDTRPDIEFPDRIRPAHNFPFDLEQAVLIHARFPPDQLNLATGDFDGGDACRIDAAARIEVRQIFGLRIFETMRMSADQHFFMLLDPLHVVFFDFMPFVHVFHGTCRALDAECVQEPPKVLQGKHRRVPKLIVGQIALHAVDDEYFLFRLPVLQNQGFNRSDPGEEIVEELGILVVIPEVILFHIPLAFQIDIVVPVNHDQTFFVIKTFEDSEYLGMGIFDVLEFVVFPQFITIPVFNVDELIFVIIFQRIQKNVFVPCEFIRKAPIASMTVTQKNII